MSAGAQQVFNFVVAEDVLPKVLTGYGLLPAVVGTSGNTDQWDRPGSVRTVHLADGTTAREEVTDYESGRYFAYRTSDYTFALRHLAAFAEGQWWFKSDANGTAVRWTYTFQAKNWFDLNPLEAVRADAVGWIYADVHRPCAGTFCSLSKRCFHSLESKLHFHVRQRLAS